jgi:hypothetical protein
VRRRRGSNVAAEVLFQELTEVGLSSPPPPRFRADIQQRTRSRWRAGGGRPSRSARPRSMQAAVHEQAGKSTLVARAGCLSAPLQHLRRGAERGNGEGHRVGWRDCCCKQVTMRRLAAGGSVPAAWSRRSSPLVDSSRRRCCRPDLTRPYFEMAGAAPVHRPERSGRPKEKCSTCQLPGRPPRACSRMGREAADSAANSRHEFDLPRLDQRILRRPGTAAWRPEPWGRGVLSRFCGLREGACRTIHLACNPACNAILYC